MPDIDKGNASLGRLLAQVAPEYESARVYGEIVNILWQRNEKQAATALEKYWNSLLKQYAFSLLCTYHIDNLDPAVYHGDIECLCSSHTHFLHSQYFRLLDNDLEDTREDVMVVALKGLMNSIAKLRHTQTNIQESHT